MTDLKRENERLRAALDKFKVELEHLRTIYPIRDLLSAKQAEVERMKKALEKVSRNHPERATVESLVKSHIVERDQLRVLLKDAEQKFQSLWGKISDELESGFSVSEEAGHEEQPSEKFIRAPEF